MRRLDDLARMVGLLSRPLPKTRPKAVRQGRDPEGREHLAKLLLRGNATESGLVGDEQLPAQAQRARPGCPRWCLRGRG